MTRWSATIHYRTDAVGLVDVTHELHELSDIQDIVEVGPHWDTIDRIVIVRGEGAIEGLTVEAAEAL